MQQNIIDGRFYQRLLIVVYCLYDRLCFLGKCQGSIFPLALQGISNGKQEHLCQFFHHPSIKQFFRIIDGNTRNSMEQQDVGLQQCLIGVNPPIGLDKVRSRLIVSKRQHGKNNVSRIIDLLRFGQLYGFRTGKEPCFLNNRHSCSISLNKCFHICFRFYCNRKIQVIGKQSHTVLHAFHIPKSSGTRNIQEKVLRTGISGNYLTEKRQQQQKRCRLQRFGKRRKLLVQGTANLLANAGIVPLCRLKGV